MSSGEKGHGLEVFLQKGLYGVMRNGKVTCPARFKRVERLQKDCGFFATAVYAAKSTGDSLKLTEITTIIDRKGQDMQVRLLGRVYWYQGYFCGIDDTGRHAYINCWDPVGNSYYYDTFPEFHVVAGVEIGWANEHTERQANCKKLRFSTGSVSPRFDEWEMFYNRNIIIARDYLIVKGDRNHAYRIVGYLDGSVLVESEERYGYQQIFPDGKKGRYFNSLPREAARMANPRTLGLRKVQTP